MASMSIQEAQEHLPDLVRGLASGDEVVILDNDKPIARLVSTKEQPPQQPRRPGTLRGTVLHMASDFDAPLDDFEEYVK